MTRYVRSRYGGDGSHKSSEVYNVNLDNFLISLMVFGDDDVFLDENASCHRQSKFICTAQFESALQDDNASCCRVKGMKNRFAELQIARDLMQLNMFG